MGLNSITTAVQWIVRRPPFEGNYLVRSSKTNIQDSEYALTEPVPSAWNAGDTYADFDLSTQHDGTSDDSPCHGHYSGVNLFNVSVHRYRKARTRLAAGCRFDDFVKNEGQF